MKKTVAVFLALTLCLPVFSAAVSADVPCANPAKTAGDANGDGKTDEADATRIKEYMAGLEVSIDLDYADVNGDGAVDGGDVVRLRNYFAGTGAELAQPALIHSWVEATCTEPKKCSVCGRTEGEPLGHTTSNGVCGRCGEYVFEPAAYSGTGDAVISDVSLPQGIYKVTMTHDGESNFSVKAYDAEGKYLDLLANEIGSYNGAVVLADNMEGGKLEIKADGNWTILIDRIADGGTAHMTGAGDWVSPWFTLGSGVFAVNTTNDGEHNFIVQLYDETGRRYSSLANEIGAYSGAVVFEKGQEGVKYCIEVSSSGNWSVSFDDIPDGGTSNIAGYGDWVSPWFYLQSGALTVNMTNDGEHNFIVQLYDETGRRYSSLANEIGPYTGSAVFNKGQEGVKYCIEVTSSGSWTVDFGLGEPVTAR